MLEPIAVLLDACCIAPAPLPLPGGGRELDTDWPTLLESAKYHSVTPLLARRLAAQPSGVPPPVLATLRARFDANALHNVALTQTLAELLDLLAAHGVAAMPIKGPALAISAYGDLALREFGDLDIVVPPRSFDRARALLAARGYRPCTPLSSAAERALRSSDHHLPMVHDELKVMVELHWSLDNGRPGRLLDGEWVWVNARSVSLLGRELPALSWSALLVYLCVHGAKHGFNRLGWIRDVAGVLAAAPAGELAASAGIAASAGAERRLALGVTLACELLGAPLREELDIRMTATVAALAAEARSGLTVYHAPSVARSSAFQYRTFDSVRERTAYILHLIAAPHVADVELVSLPRWLGGAYYVLRPARLVARRAKRLLDLRA